MSCDYSRLFLAFPATELSESLSLLQDQLALPGRRVPVHQFHLTLRFLGALTPTQFDSLHRQLSGVRLAKFHLRLDNLGYFPKAQVAWLGPTRVPTALSTLYQELLLRCASLRLAKPHKAYRPHVSVYRNTPAPPRITISPLAFSPPYLALYNSTASEQGVHYEELARWPLVKS
ncbi:RNA 2',3'-cyclic phosphodiesterase [Oceanisphaera avium]|uniref:RNA 2',3'-cyclic phosphodiesterase n=1 Tax=Oceanisphaera avium TaxID=1903694 RepID=UPI0012F8525D|nr:RNA 2',3'-cyclic phosphodiesterase [Oceanisphaera avium]